MVNSDLSIETPFQEKFAGQIYMFESMNRDANIRVSSPGLDFFWIDFSLQRCKNALKLLRERDIFIEFRNDIKMTEVVKSFDVTIIKLKSVKENSLTKNP